jgi:hypothetical protein
MMTGEDDDAASIREDSFLAELIPQVAEHLAEHHGADFDAETGRARFLAWLAAHTKEPAAPQRRRPMPSGARLLARYWGYLALALAGLGYFAHVLKPAIVLVLCLGAFGYFLFLAPAWCGATTREGQMCRNNSRGLLMGCWVRGHKWQKMRMTFVPGRWRKLVRILWASPKERLASIAGIASIVGLLLAGVPLVLH